MCEGVFVYVLVRWGGGRGRQKYECSAISIDSRLFTIVDQQEFSCVKCSDYVRGMVATGYVP